MQFARGKLDLALQVLESVGKTNVVSSPRITVLNNEEAKVLVGTNQPYVTTTTTVTENNPITSQNVTYIDVGVSLTVTPTINQNGYVTMKIKPEVSSLGESFETPDGDEFPVVSTSETETTIMVKDGHTIVIAGLIEDREEESQNKIPVLGDIPILGYLFKGVSHGSEASPEKRELVIFLTPYVVEGTETFPETHNVWLRDSLRDRTLLESPVSIATDTLPPRSAVRELPRVAPAQGLPETKIADNIKWLDMPEVEEEPDPLDYIVTPEASSYIEDLRNKIYWTAKDVYPPEFEGDIRHVEVLFTLTRDGWLMGDPTVVNAVDTHLAGAACSAVKRAEPFPPFPREMEKDEEVFKITITYQ